MYTEFDIYVLNGKGKEKQLSQLNYKVQN